MSTAFPRATITWNPTTGLLDVAGQSFTDPTAALAAARISPSPTPWALVDNGWEIWDADERSIACTGYDNAYDGHLKALDLVNGELIVRCVNAHDELVATLAELVERCDGEEGVRADGSNIQTMRAHAVLAKFQVQWDEAHEEAVGEAEYREER
jgi:hypothetical protein